MSDKPCQECGGGGSIWVPNPIPPPASVLVTCQECKGSGKE